MLNTDLIRLLAADVEAFGASNGLEVSMPNIDFDNSLLTKFLKFDLLPTKPEVLTLHKGKSNHIWVCQITVFYSDGKTVGAVPATKIVDLLLKRFYVTKKFVGNDNVYKIISPPNPEPTPLKDGAWFYIPVDFQVQTIN